MRQSLIVSQTSWGLSGAKLDEKGQHEEAKMFYLAALEGRRRALGGEHMMDTLASLNNMGCLLDDLEDYEGGARLLSTSA